MIIWISGLSLTLLKDRSYFRIEDVNDEDRLTCTVYDRLRIGDRLFAFLMSAWFDRVI